MRRSARLAQLWQLPLLILSLSLFGYAAYLFIDPRPGPTVEQRVEAAETMLRADRPRAAVEQLNELLNTEKPDPMAEGRIHLLLGQALAQVQKLEKFSVADNHLAIIEQTKLAIQLGVRADADMHQRIADSYAALKRPAEAIANWRQAIMLEPARTLSLQRRIAELQVSYEDLAGAAVTLESYLSARDLARNERAWGLRELARIQVEANNFTEARDLLTKAVALLPEQPGASTQNAERLERGQIDYYLGYCAWKLGQTQEAERHLRAARDLLRVEHTLDADAAYALGRLHAARGEHPLAISFFDAVLTSHPNSKSAPLARLERGVSHIALGDAQAGLADLRDLTKYLSQHEAARSRCKTAALEGLRTGRRMLEMGEDYQGAMELLEYEQELEPKPEAPFFAHLAQVYGRRADQVEKAIGQAPPAERPLREQQVRDLRSRAGDACVAHARAMTMSDASYGDALWKAIQLYDRAADTVRVIAALELFVAQRPEDPITPDALLRLGKAYQAAGLLDKSIGAFQRNQLRYPNTVAASKSAIPLALAYMAKGPEFHSKAEAVLRSVIENNAVVDPSAEEFKQSLLELAGLYHRTQRYEEAIARLEEMTQRYAQDERIGQWLYLMADSYRRSATLLDARLASARPADAIQQAIDMTEAIKARRDRLSRARQLYDRVIEIYRSVPPAGDADRLNLKYAHFYRADCMFDLGEYAEAIRLYDAAAFRYQDDPSALAAYVQIVNSNLALGKMEEAKAANERAKWLLRRMPADSFNNGAFPMPKQYWEQYLRWAGESGMW